MRHLQQPEHPDLGLWGKWGDASSSKYALLGHLLDSALVAEILFDAWLPERLIQRLDASVSSSGVGARILVVAGAGLHDLGKINPIFQAQLLSGRSELFHDQVAYMAAGEYWSPSGDLLSPQKGNERAFVTRHEIFSGVLEQGGLGINPGSFASMLAGHHGKWRSFGEDQFDPDTYPVACTYYETLCADQQWSAQVEAHRSEVLYLLDVEVPSADFDRAVTPLLTALVCLSDWVASSEDSIAHGRRLDDVLRNDRVEFLRLRREFLHRYTLETLGVPHKPTGTFTEIFGFAPSRPVQQELAPPSAPGLSVVMVPMGEGKTEAALAHWMSSADHNQGLYFALPTMATADAMFDRVRSFFAQTEDPVLGTLAHGRSVLNAFYQTPKNDAHIVSSEVGGLTPQDWFTGKHRALLSPVTVGTVDQLLAGTLRHRYNFLRLLGAATKTVVLDEVHTYDPYMSELLCGFLQWAGWLNLDVVLLSATLSHRRLREYLSAYVSGSGGTLTPDIPVSYPSIVRLIDGVVSSTDLSSVSSGREVTLDIKWAGARGRSTWEESVAQALEVRAQFPDAKIGIILNTVVGAQKAAAALVDAGHTPSVLHARMPANERFKRTERAIDDFGKTSLTGPAILVATQVVEASIDLDFDVLITEICPAASLLQRSGRVWRHDLGDGTGRRRRPTGLTAPCVVIAYPNPMPNTGRTFLPYLTAEISKTFIALGSGTTEHLSIPRDVQWLVDAADVSLHDIEILGEVATDAVVSEKAKRLLGQDSRIPSPQEVSTSLRALERFTAGELGNEEYATRLNELASVTILPISRDNPMAWCAEVPNSPTRAEVIALLGYTIPISGALANKVYRALANGDDSVREGIFTHRLLAGVVIIDMDKTDLMRLGPLGGLSSK